MEYKIRLKFSQQSTVNFSSSSQQLVLPITLIIEREGKQIKQREGYLNPPSEQLNEAFEKWRYFIGLHGNLKVRRQNIKGFNNEQNTYSLNFYDLANELKCELNNWLRRDNWLDSYGSSSLAIIESIESYLDTMTEKDEIEINIETRERKLRSLPWQKWDVFSLRKGIEIAISATDFEKPYPKPVSQRKATVRILAIVGDKRLVGEQVQSSLEELKKYGAELKLLEEPKLKDLKTHLNDPEGWHIFCFAGHSESSKNGQIGSIQINPNEEEGIVSISALKDLLKDVIQRKLQLAIFNSCDGLGLANQLTELSLPYCIVMRERVESSFATKLLEYFLKELVKDRSLSIAMSSARQRLEDPKENFKPGESWLPVIVANPLAEKLTWNRLFIERRLPKFWEIALFVFVLLLLFALPIGIWTEFHELEKLRFYAQLYPHIILYPSLILWMPLYACYKAFCMIRGKKFPLKVTTIFIAVVTFVVLSFEIRGDRMMLFEFKPNAEVTIRAEQLPKLLEKWEISKNQIFNIPSKIYDARQAFDSEDNLTLRKSDLESAVKHFKAFDNEHLPAFQGLMRIATTYDVWKKSNFWSISRYFYAINFVLIAGCGLQILTLISIILSNSKALFNKNKYLFYLILCELGILLWVPFQRYTIDYTKNFLFSSEFQGGYSGLHFVLPLIILILSALTGLAINNNATSAYKVKLFSFLGISLLFTFISGNFAVFLVNKGFGIDSQAPITAWITSASLFFFTFFVIVNPWINKNIIDD